MIAKAFSAGFQRMVHRFWPVAVYAAPRSARQHRAQQAPGVDAVGVACTIPAHVRAGGRLGQAWRPAERRQPELNPASPSLDTAGD